MHKPFCKQCYAWSYFWWQFRVFNRQPRTIKVVHPVSKAAAHPIFHVIIYHFWCVSQQVYQSYVSSFSFSSSGRCLRQRLVLGHSQTHFSCWQIVSLHSVCKCAHHSQSAWMWFGTSVWSLLQKKTDRRETEWGISKRRGGGTPGLLRKKPSVFPSLLSPPLWWWYCLWAEPGDSVRQMQNVCASVCGVGGWRRWECEKKDGQEKASTKQSSCVGSCQSSWWRVMKLKVRSGNTWSCWRGWGALKGALIQTCGSLLHHHQQQHHSPAPCLYACGVYLRACLTTAWSLWWTDTRWQQPKCLAL